MTEQTFSVLQHNQEFLVIKKAVGKPLVVASCYLEHYADLITDLLEKHEQEKEENKEPK